MVYYAYFQYKSFLIPRGVSHFCILWSCLVRKDTVGMLPISLSFYSWLPWQPWHAFFLFGFSWNFHFLLMFFFPGSNYFIFAYIVPANSHHPPPPPPTPNHTIPTKPHILHALRRTTWANSSLCWNFCGRTSWPKSQRHGREQKFPVNCADIFFGDHTKKTRKFTISKLH